MQPRTAVSNTSTYAAIQTIPVGAADSVDIAVNGPDDTVYVVNDSGHNVANSLSVINGRTASLDETIVINASYPSSTVAVNQNDDTVYTVGPTSSSGAGRGCLGARRGSSPNVETSSQCDDNLIAAQSIAVNSIDDTIYVTRSTGSDAAYVAGRAPTTITPLPVGGRTYALAVDQLDDTVFLSLPADDSLGAVAGRTNTLGPYVTVDDSPAAVAVNGPDDTVYLASDCNSCTRIQVINGRTSAVGAPITLNAGGKVLVGIRALAVDETDDTLYAIVPNAGKNFQYFNGRNTDDSDGIAPLTDNGISTTLKALAVDDSGPNNQGLVYALGSTPAGVNVVQVIAQVAPTLIGTTTGGVGATVELSVASNPVVAYDLQDNTVLQFRFNGDDAKRVNATAGAGNTWTVALPSGLPTGPVSVEARFNGYNYAFAGTFTVTGSPTPPPVYPPGAPTNLAAVAGNAEASVSWTAPTYAGSYPITDYEVVSSPSGRSCVAKVPALSCTVTGLSNGTSYTFRARALNGAGWGAYSDPSNAVTPSAPVTPSIMVAGSRDAMDPRIIRVAGESVGLVGRSVTPYLRFPGEAAYQEG
ncbi:MAG: fibronectin type III domain-containing protein, partial [bacterium]